MMGKARIFQKTMTHHGRETMRQSPRITRRTLVATLAGTTAASATGLSYPRPAIAQPAKVRYTLSWLPTGQYAYLTVAQQLGYFKSRGIDLDVSRGYGSMAATQAVATGKFEMGGAQTGANLLSMMRGLNLRLLGTQGYDATLGIIVLKNGPIKTPKDLEGKKVGESAAGGDTPFFPAYCKLASVDFSKVKIVQLDSKILEQSAMSGVVDAIVVTGLSSIPNFISQNVPIRMFPYSKVGLQFYWVNTITSPSYYAANKEVAENVQAGIAEGMKFTLLHPEEAMERHIKAHPELALGKNGKLYVELGEGLTRAIMIAPESINHGLGYTDTDKVDQQAKIVKQYIGKPGDHDLPKADAFVTNTRAVTLTSAEWQQVKASTKKYATLLGQV
jgi:NitT/TauT family transport system substrate-binding protein